MSVEDIARGRTSVYETGRGALSLHLLSVLECKKLKTNDPNHPLAALVKCLFHEKNLSM